MLGLPKGEVFLVPWTEEWIKEYTNEANQIEQELGHWILKIHHIGSTAIKDISAKPIIDIAIELLDFSDGLLCVPKLEQLGYSYKGTNILPERHYFNKGEPRTHQIHMYQTGSKYLQEQLAFRDYLNENEDAKYEYEQLKQTLSREHQTNKHAYADAKTEFVQQISLKENRRNR